MKYVQLFAHSTDKCTVSGKPAARGAKTSGRRSDAMVRRRGGDALEDVCLTVVVGSVAGGRGRAGGNYEGDAAGAHANIAAAR